MKTYAAGCMVVNVDRPVGGIAVRVSLICPVNVGTYFVLGVGDGSILSTGDDSLLAVKYDS